MSDSSLPLGILRDKARLDAGFDLDPTDDGGWRRLGVSGLQGVCWLRPAGSGTAIALPLMEQLQELTAAQGPGLPLSAAPASVQEALPPLPPGSSGALFCATELALLNALQRIRHLLVSAPPRLIEQLEALSAKVSTTEAVAEVKRRIGQDLYRQALLTYWNGACALTGLAVPELLRASHAKPWKEANDAERLDVHNGLLLAVHLDALFDRGFIAFDDTGAMLISPRLPAAAASLLGIDGPPRRLRWLIPQHLPYLQWHRKHLFDPQQSP